MKVLLKIALFLFCLLEISGCDKMSDGAIFISEDVIKAGSASETFIVDVDTDDSWTVVARESSGFNVNWMTVRPPRGKGKGSVTLALKENDTTESREVNVIFTSGSGKTAVLKVVQKPYSLDEVAEIRVGTFNLRISPQEDYDSGNGWDTRKAMVVSSVRNIDFDIWGMQEVTGVGNGGIPAVGSNMQADLTKELGDTYEFLFFSPYSQDGKGRSASGLAYKKDKFTISGYNYFWTSDTPDVMINNDGTHSRGGCCAVFTHKETGVRLFFMEAHASTTEEANNSQAYIYADIERLYNPEGLPSVFVGDLNASDTSDAYKEYTKWWSDAYRTLFPAGKVSGPTGTHNAFNPSKEMTEKSRIDYIFFRGEIVPVHYTCDDTLYDGHYPSDHFPIYCDFRISHVE